MRLHLLVMVFLLVQLFANNIEADMESTGENRILNQPVKQPGAGKIENTEKPAGRQRGPKPVGPRANNKKQTAKIMDMEQPNTIPMNMERSAAEVGEKNAQEGVSHVFTELLLFCR